MPISTPSNPQAAALLSHILSQMHQNISFLADHNYISSTEATDLTARLTHLPASSNPAECLVSGVQPLEVGPARAPEPARRIPPPPPRTNVQQATALWAYNEDGREPNDLSFSAGEVVEIIDETNADWWTGKCRGRQGLFPSNHVKKLESHSRTATVSPSPAMVSMPSMPVASSYYSPPPGPPQPYGVPPNEKMYQPHYAAPPPAPVVALQPPMQVPPPSEPKKNKFGKLGSTMATSAAGGVGFGAGAAIGSGIVHAIF